MKPRLYFDTSVFGGINDIEFIEETQKIFEMVLNEEIICVYSELTETELKNAPIKIKEFFNDLPRESVEKLNMTKDAYELAEQYVAEKVVGKTSFDDCLHIAIATLNKVDFLISWNFKHIVNVFRIRGYNAINMKNGLIQLDIRSPKEIIR